MAVARRFGPSRRVRNSVALLLRLAQCAVAFFYQGPISVPDEPESDEGGQHNRQDQTCGSADSAT